MKICPTCKINKDDSFFGRDRRCKECCNIKSRIYRANNRIKTVESNKRSRNKNPIAFRASLRKARLKRFGLLESDYVAMLQKQNGVCAVCKSSDKKSLAVDHCHLTGMVRGLLCGACNKAEGLLKSNPVIIRALANYVEYYKENL